jgi:hypothetical protein
MNRLYFADNLSWLRNRDEFPNESVDLAFHFADAREWSASLSLNRAESSGRAVLGRQFDISLAFRNK